MNFLHPMLLLGALGVALPILAHLLNKHQFKQTPWAAMRFLDRSMKVRSRQIKLRDLLLLALRCLAVLLVALAVAMPAMRNAEGLAAKVGDRQAGIVIALDASYSMRHNDGASTRFARALEKVREIADDIPVGAPVSLVILGDEHEVVARNMTFDRERFEAVLQDREPSPGRLRLETVPAVLSDLLSGMEGVKKEIHLVTDMQRSDWADPADWLRNALKDLGKQADTFIIPVQGGDENLAVTDFELFSGLLRKGTTARYSATVHNFGSAPASNVTVKCLLRENVVDSKVITVIAPRSSQTISFFVPFHNAGPVELSARLDDDALPLDNVRRLVANIRERVSILCVEGKSYGGSLESFVVKALRARGGDAGKEEFKVRSVSWLSLPSQDLAEFDIVVFSDVPEITAQQAEQLGNHVREGGGLIWFAGENVKAGAWNERSALAGGSLLPATIGPPRKISDALGAGRPLEPLFPDHPVCRPLRSLPKDLLSETEFHQVIGVTPLPGSTSLLTLSGSDTPILLEQGIGRGHVFMFTSSSNPSWNNMALTPVFPMLLQQMATYLTGREFERARTVGSSLSLSYPDRPDANDGVFETPSGTIIRVPVREFGGEHVAFLEQAREAGFYQARVSLQSPGQPIAVNVDTQESDVRCLDPGEARGSLAETGVIITPSAIGHAGDVRTGRDYWRVLLMAGLATFLLETLIAANLFAGRTPKRGDSPQPGAEAEKA